jgi:molecular chaperone DnaK (HSP70)
MGHKIAIDFGTTNSVISHWDERRSAAEIVSLPHISDTHPERPSVVPSLVYLHDAAAPHVSIGQQVREGGFDAQRDNRLFRNFKRGIVTTPAPPPRDIDGHAIDDRAVGRIFLNHLFEVLPYPAHEIDQMILTAPVAAFEGYLHWLNEMIDHIAADKIRVIDESTAAALGYGITEPGAIVLVFDFGGGTLDLSLVQLPESPKSIGGFLRNMLGQARQSAAKVIAKAGRVMGGSDIDQWILSEVLKQAALDPNALQGAYASLLTRCETAKIALTQQTETSIVIDVGTEPRRLVFTREQLEGLLTEHGFYDALRRVVDKVMHTAHQRGIYREDIKYVLMVGGTSLMPSVQRTLSQYFGNITVRAEKPFTAVAEGALQLALGNSLDDYLIHSYGLRHLNGTGVHAWDEIIPSGTVYPMTQPVELILAAAHERRGGCQNDRAPEPAWHRRRRTAESAVYGGCASPPENERDRPPDGRGTAERCCARDVAVGVAACPTLAVGKS